jgi:N-acetylneuraminic acid mutarotase
MKAQEIKHNMKRNFIWISAVLTLIGFLGLASISLTVEDTWTTKANMPTARLLLSTSMVNGKIYVIGGESRGAAALHGMSTVEEYDPATDTWTTKVAMPTARHGPSTSVVNGKIYAIGGTPGGVPCDGAGVFSTVEVEEYDPATDTWTRKADMPKARMHFSTSAVDGKIYAIGGSVIVYPWAPVSAVDEYDTGFVPSIMNVDSSIMSVEAIGKLTTTWGKIK